MTGDTHTGPALAAALGGTFDFDSGAVRFEGRSYFVRCGFTGKVQLVQASPRGIIPAVNLGMMSEGVEVLRREFLDALTSADLIDPVGLDR